MNDTLKENFHSRTSKCKMVLSTIALMGSLTACEDPDKRTTGEIEDEIFTKYTQTEHIKDSLYKSNTLSLEDKHAIQRLEEELRIYIIFAKQNGERQWIKKVEPVLDRLYNKLVETRKKIYFEKHFHSRNNLKNNDLDNTETRQEEKTIEEKQKDIQEKEEKNKDLERMKNNASQ